MAAFFFHYFVYMDNASGEVPIIQSYTDAPVDLPELVLCEEKSSEIILKPFLKSTIRYQVDQNGTYTKYNIIVTKKTILYTRKNGVHPQK